MMIVRLLLLLLFFFFLKINRIEASDEMDKLKVSRKSDQKCKFYRVHKKKTNGRTDRQTDGWTEEQTDRQTTETTP